MIEALLVVPLAGALLAFALPRRGVAIGLFTSACTCAAATWAVHSVYRLGALQTTLGGWPAPLGIELRLDGLAALMLMVTALAGLALGVFAAGYFHAERERNEATPLFWPLWLVLWASLNGLFLAVDAFTLYVLLEIALLSAVALATLAATDQASLAALRYLLAAMTGSLFYLFGVALLYHAYGILDYELIAERLEPDALSSAALLLMTVGLMTKAALFPLHFWLPAAHASAPAPVSALLSGLVIKGAFYVLLRLWMTLHQAVPAAAAQAVAALAAAAVVWGAIQALRQRRLKMLIAYSTVAQVGLFAAALPALLPEAGAASADPRAWAGGAIQASAHALAKSALFLAAGIIILALGRDEIAATRGLAWRLPVTTVALVLGGAALFGIPGSAADLGKSLLLDAASAHGTPWWGHVLDLASWLTLAYMVAMLRYAVHRAPREGWSSVPLWPQLVPLALAAASLALGWLGGDLLEFVLLDEGRAP